MKKKIIAALLSLACILFAMTVGSCVGTGKNPKDASSSLEPAKMDESINPDKSVQKPEPVKSLIQYDEPISVGKTNKGLENEARGTKVAKELKVLATGYYSPEPNQKRYLSGSFKREKRMNGSGKITALGTVPQKGRTISADPKIIPLGTKVRIKGYPGVFIVEDTGSKIKGNRIDIYTGKGEQGLEEALDLGGKRLIVEVLKLPRSGKS